MENPSSVYISRSRAVMNAVRKVLRYSSDEERSELLQDLTNTLENYPVKVPVGRPKTRQYFKVDTKKGKP